MFQYIYIIFCLGGNVFGGSSGGLGRKGKNKNKNRGKKTTPAPTTTTTEPTTVDKKMAAKLERERKVHHPRHFLQNILLQNILQ